MAQLSDLTPRELEILRLVLAGWTNRAIAAEIHICEKTVEFHLNNVYTKIGLRTRMLASLWAIRQGVQQELASQDRGSDLSRPPKEVPATHSIGLEN